MTNKLNIQFERDFTIAPNQICRDKRLSFKAKGLFITIISLAEEWDFSIAGLASLSDNSTSAVKSGIKELEQYGYLEWINHKSATGQFAVTVNVYLPDDVIPHKKTTVGENPLRENIDNKEITNKELTLNKELINKRESNDSVSDSKQQRSDIWDVLIEELQYTSADITKNVRGQLNNAIKQLFDIGATPSEIKHRAKLYREKFPNSAFTAMALVNRWADLKATKISTIPSKTTSGIDYDKSSADVWEFNENGEVKLK